MEQSEILSVALSPFDQTIPRLYVHKLFCFALPDAEKRVEAAERLEQATTATIFKWPFIAGNVTPAETGTLQSAVQLHYSSPPANDAATQVLTVKELTCADFPWTYKDLVVAGMPPSVMRKEALSTMPEWPEFEETHPALAIQANFIEGGLILCFAFHHAVADGGSFCTFLKAFAAATKNPSPTKSTFVSPVANRLPYGTAPEGDILPLEAFPEYSYKDVPIMSSIRSSSSAHITNRIFTFSATTVQELEEAIRDHLKNNPVGVSFVSNIACLSSLIWVAVVRARRKRLEPDEITKMGIAVNSRAVMDPKLSEDYFGNAVVHTNATAKVSELLYESDDDVRVVSSPISISTLALGASRMRKATEGVNSQYVSERLKTFSALRDPTETSRAYTRAMECARTGLDFSSWRDQGADVEFDIPGVGTSSAHWWRKTWSPNEGAYNILPRKGGSKGTADWEVSLGLSVEDMTRVCREGELGSWASRIE